MLSGGSSRHRQVCDHDSAYDRLCKELRLDGDQGQPEEYTAITCSTAPGSVGSRPLSRCAMLCVQLCAIVQIRSVPLLPL